ncbi:hypothetical protein [Myroides marinus]|uniref:hypothetical protein n=1 Tax=Myroides marinus TaxID=703342 RepID=UPI002575A496|nr:hypothetical protein [Myroides marinus]MDM1380511.1 hypothetical protein [Myroides marinus]MDM1387812.1 hypothetical protein [Myroides marinus]MDM1394995.1 hypothetical protein [Myroides marinus]
MRNKLIILGTFLISMMGWSQLRESGYQPIFNVGYSQGTHSMLQLGMEYDVITTEEKWLFIGGGLMATPYYKEWHLLPYVDVTKGNALRFYGLKITTKHIQPQVGVSLLNFMDIGIGYAFPFNEDKVPVIKGFNVGLKVRISGNDKVYPRLNIGF